MADPDECRYHCDHEYRAAGRPEFECCRCERRIPASSLAASVDNAECPHEWMGRGTSGDRWRECFLCGTQETTTPPRFTPEQRQELADMVERLRVERPNLPDGI